MTDRILVEIATGSTLLFALGAHAIRSRPIFINALFLLIVSAALCAFAIRSHKSILSVPSILLHLVFDGTDRRYSLLLFWSICVLSSLIFCVVVNVSDHSSTIHRKFFHLTISLIFMTGLRYDVEFVWLCGWLVLCIFIIVEIFRSFRVPLWASYLDDWFLVFVDSQDSGNLILTPIYLLAGIFLPLFISPVSNFESIHLYHFAGVLTVGVGDSLAAIVGSRYGTHHWSGSAKSKEGTVTMALSQFVFGLIVCLSYIKGFELTTVSILRLASTCVVCAFAEAHMQNVDNIVLPLIAYLMLW
ncbi:Dolichol kinase [Toxocara canis]|uniref:dolichol kinase n=1 Tax=Toxocara canis TaxID=6265 RepID=A0A0B2V4T3_TOXCA|nr:Dolichol kinase [Toxocara canis]